MRFLSGGTTRFPGSLSQGVRKACAAHEILSWDGFENLNNYVGSINMYFSKKSVVVSCVAGLAGLAPLSFPILVSYAAEI